MTWRTPVISLATALSIVAFGQREMISNPVLGDDSSTLLSPLAGTENLPTYTPTPIEEPIPTPTPKPRSEAQIPVAPVTPVVSAAPMAPTTPTPPVPPAVNPLAEDPDKVIAPGSK